jgi:hypothetical protein
MKLATLICENALTEVATAIAAIPATEDADIAATVARVATIAVANPTSETSACRKWRIRHLNGAAMTVLFTPSVTRADVAVVYPGASCEPTPETTARAPTAAEDNELRRLIGVVLADAGEADPRRSARHLAYRSSRGAYVVPCLGWRTHEEWLP